MIAQAVVLAGGLGTRMRRGDRGPLEPGQAAAADQGRKGMIPFGTRPFLDFILSRLADAGCTRICLVVGPEHHDVRERYARDAVPTRFTLEYAVQERPLGTAHAVLAAERFAAGRPALVQNADNHYPLAALRALSGLSRAGLALFRRSALVARGNIAAERVRQFALCDLAPDGTLARIVEKPDDATLARFGDDPLVSMNLWLLPPSIYRACREIDPSPRGEFELQDAVQRSIDHFGERYRVVESREGVLDLSSRADIPAVAERLRNEAVRL